MKKHLTSIILVILLLAGLSLLLYPTFSDWWNSFHQSRAIAGYDAAVQNMDDLKAQEMLKEARAYNIELAKKGNLAKLTEAELESYKRILDVTGTGIMGYLEIPSIHVSLPVYHGTEESILQVAVGHIEGTAFPVGGESTHAVLSGHRGLPSARLLTDLDQMVEGDIFTVKVLGEVMTYMVDQIRIVLPHEVEDLAIVPGKDYLTLVTCTPYGINSHRLLVRGKRIATEEEHIAVVTPDAVQINTVKVAIWIAAPILALYLLVSLLARPRGRRSRS